MPDRDRPTWGVGVPFSQNGVTGLMETEHVRGTAPDVGEGRRSRRAGEAVLTRGVIDGAGTARPAVRGSTRAFEA